MKIAIAQFDSAIGSFDANIDKMVHFASDAADRGCRLVVFPELAVCGYPPKDFLEHREFVEGNLKALERLIESVKGIAVLCGYVEPNKHETGKPNYNTAILFENGSILAKVYKRLLPAYDIFDETRYFEPGDDFTPVEFHGKRLGIAICEDIWNDNEFMSRSPYEIDPVRELANNGTDIFITISASPFDMGKIELRYRMLKHLSSKYNRPFLYANVVGGQDSIVFDGHSLAYDQNGTLMARAKAFEEDLIVIDLDAGKGDIHPVPQSREETLVNALVLALKDYMARCGFRSVVLGLSGGIDSSVTAAIAVRALGAENVLGVIMPSPYTSAESIEDAEALARNLGIQTLTIPITDVFHSYLKTLEPVFSGLGPDVTEENLQARIRGNILMALSNKFGHMVLSTGNKSELAVGYCTLYGDLTGGYALLSDVFKTEVYSVARFLNKTNKTGILIPERVLEKAPSAELRPGQRDQDDLPPYDILDQILEGYLEGRMAPYRFVKRGFDRDVVAKVIQMVDRNEYKRLQAPIGPKVTTKAFGYGRRYPVAHGFRHKF